MLVQKTIFTLLLFLLIFSNGFSQKVANWTVKPIDSAYNKALNSTNNTINNTHSLFPLLTKLYRIKHFSNEKAIFVHIGDSHIQADMMTSVIRNSFQDYFGNAGRGLLVPFQVAKSNAPSDIISNSKSSWKTARITKLDTTVTCGIGAFGLESTGVNPDLYLELRTINGIKESFDKVTLFFDSKSTDLQLEASANTIKYLCFETPQTQFASELNDYSSSLKINFQTNEKVKFFGASVEKNNVGGVIYHSIGANGAKYSDYSKTTTFWKQLPSLNADCYIISLGTNEAQDPNLSEENFLIPVKVMVEKLKIASPNAVIILSTPPVSYYKKLRPNKSLETISNAIISFCNANNLVYWDLFNASYGLEGTKSWKSNQLLNTDLVHYTKKGYVLQADLFVTAFLKTWNEFLLKN